MAIKREHINHYLNVMGVKHAHIGYRYLIASIQIGAEQPQLLIRISDLYEKVAELYGTNSFCVERAVRYSLKPIKLPNKEFISKAIDDMNIDIDSGSA